MNRGDIGENYVAVHYDNDYTCRIFCIIITVVE